MAGPLSPFHTFSRCLSFFLWGVQARDLTSSRLVFGSPMCTQKLPEHHGAGSELVILSVLTGNIKSQDCSDLMLGRVE